MDGFANSVGLMPKRIADVRSASGLLLTLMLFAGTGCSSMSSDVGVMVFADPGKYQYKTCDEINAAAATAANRRQTLRELIDRAEQGAGGMFVSAIAYRGEYRTVTEELIVIENSARAKNCLTAASWRSRDAIQ
jgi:hypothetical protein